MPKPPGAGICNFLPSSLTQTRMTNAATMSATKPPTAKPTIRPMPEGGLVFSTVRSLLRRVDEEVNEIWGVDVDEFEP